MDEFAGASFISLVSAPGRTRDTEMSMQHIPGGDINYIDIGGTLSPTLSMELFFAKAASHLSLENKVGTQGILKYVDGTTASTTLLKSLTRRARLPNGQTFATAEFILAS